MSKRTAAHARAARDAAIEQIGISHSQWVARALKAVRKVARENAVFTTDDLWPYLPEPPVDPRALGPLMKRAQAMGICEPTGITKQSSRRKCHARPLRVWYSMSRKPANDNGIA